MTLYRLLYRTAHLPPATHAGFGDVYSGDQRMEEARRRQEEREEVRSGWLVVVGGS